MSAEQQIDTKGAADRVARRNAEKRAGHYVYSEHTCDDIQAVLCELYELRAVKRQIVDALRPTLAAVSMGETTVDEAEAAILATSNETTLPEVLA